MNKARRSQIEKAKELLELARDDEQAARDNLPDNLQDGDKAMQMDENIDRLQAAIDELEEVVGVAW